MTFEWHESAGEKGEAHLPQPRLRRASETKADLQVVYDRIADLASDHLIRESGCVPPPRAEICLPLTREDPHHDLADRSFWVVLRDLGRAVASALGFRGSV